MAKDEKKVVVSTIDRTLGRRRFLELSAGAVAYAAMGPGLLGCGGSGAEGAGRSAALAAGATEPVFFVHISDSHFGGDSHKPADEDPKVLREDPKALLTSLVHDILPTVVPLATIHTGDIVNEGFEIQPWKDYSAVFETTNALSYPKNYVEILGNHDQKHNSDKLIGDVGHGITHFNKYSMIGRVTGSPVDKYGLTLLPYGGQSVCLIRTNTAESPTVDNQENIDGWFSAEQQQALLADPNFDPDRYLNVVLGHHPIKVNQAVPPAVPPAVGIKKGNELVVDLVAAAKAPIYLCGHLHAENVMWVDNPTDPLRPILMVQANTFGRRTRKTNFFLVAYDQGFPTAKLVSIDASAPPAGQPAQPSIAWPLVFITSPSNALLGGNNPYASPIGSNETPNLRAMVFPPNAGHASITAVKYLLDGGAVEVPLTNSTKRLWEGALDLSALAPGQHTVTVRAYLDTVLSDDHHITVGEDTITLNVIAPPVV